MCGLIGFLRRVSFSTLIGFLLFGFFLTGDLSADGLYPDLRLKDIPLVGDPESGRANLVGFPRSGIVSWAKVQVVDGSRVLSLDESDPVYRGMSACSQYPLSPSCTMSRVFYKWTGAAWQAFNGMTPGMVGSISAFDAFVVTAVKPDIALRIPATRGWDPPENDDLRYRGWKVRLIAQSGSKQDDGNLIGQIKTASDGLDAHDLEELSPLGDSYLSIVFENERFPETDWGFTSDFRAPSIQPTGEWSFVVHASNDVRKITLRWEGDHLILYSGWLIDLETGEWIRPRPGGSYSFRNGPEDRRFIFALYYR